MRLADQGLVWVVGLALIATATAVLAQSAISGASKLEGHQPQQAVLTTLPLRVYGSIHPDPTEAPSFGPSRFLLSNNSGSPVWDCHLSSISPDEWSQWPPCEQAEAWFSGPALYQLQVFGRAADGASDYAYPPAQFPVTGREESILARIVFWRAATSNPAVLDMQVLLQFEANGAARLRRAWRPTADGTPRYILLNTSSRTIHGTAMWNNFFGFIEREVDDKWWPYQRGGFCGTVGDRQPLDPGATVESHEGFFIGEPQAFVPGRYRYVVRFGFSPVPQGIPTRMLEIGQHRIETHTVFQVYDDFEINEP